MKVHLEIIHNLQEFIKLNTKFYPSQCYCCIFYNSVKIEATEIPMTDDWIKC